MRKLSDFHEYQQLAVDYLYEDDNDGGYLVAPVGAGKTVIALTAISELLDEKVIRNPLVIAPKNTAINVWSCEHHEWEHLCTRSVSVIIGTPAQRLAALRADADIYIATYDNLQWLTKQKEFKKFDLLCLDEATRIKNPSGKRGRALYRCIDQFKVRFAMSGTPATHGVQDLFNQVKIVWRGEIWGNSFPQWRDQYWRVDPYTHEMKEISFGTSYELEKVSVEFADLTHAVAVEEIPREGEDQHLTTHFELSDDERRAYEKMAKDFVIAISEQDFVVGGTAAICLNKLRQISSGFVYDTPTGVAHRLGDSRLKALEQLSEDIGRQPVLIGYQFKEELEMLQEAFPEAPFIGAGSKDVPGTIERWNASEIPRLLIHPQSGGHGLNLQYGDGHRLIWYSLPWSLEYYLQLIGRISRQGQKNRVQIHTLIDPDTVDIIVRQALRDYANVQDAVIEAVKKSNLDTKSKQVA